MYGFELDKQVSLRDVYEALNGFMRLGGFTSHEIDLGEAGTHTVDCDKGIDGLDIESIVRGLADGR